MKALKIFLILPIIFDVHFLYAGQITFDDLWHKVIDRSSDFMASKHELNASSFLLKRAQLHWLPSVGVKAAAYTSNDPGANFFGILAQRSVVVNDFIPSTLNNPGYQSYQNVVLGLDLPLFEGGRRLEIVSMQKADLELQRLQLKKKERTIFEETLTHYGGLVVDQSTESKLLALKDQVQKILSRYAIGNESNPVGYSGILGLKGLNNRIQAELISIQSSKRSHQFVLAEKTALAPEVLIPQETQIKEVLKFSKVLMSSLSLENKTLDEEMAAHKEDVVAAAKQAERSRFLPAIGLFGNTMMAHGSRNEGYSVTGGAYLTWSLFNPENYNRMSEQEERQKAVLAFSEVVKQNSKISKSVLNESELAIDKTLQVLAESDQILNEQVKVASRLFHSGNISALQLSEVYNRRADLILNLRQAEQNWTQLKAQKILLIQSNEDYL